MNAIINTAISQEKNILTMSIFFNAGPTGIEPAIFSVTGRRDKPLHYGPNIQFCSGGGTRTPDT